MYQTRRFNPKTCESYLTVGDPFEKPKPNESRHKSKQFQTNPPKQGQTAGYFTSHTYAADNFSDTNGYRMTQPRADRKLGFGSLDASRRDEFTLDVRAQQYKELLKGEHYFEKKYSEENDQKHQNDFTNGTFHNEDMTQGLNTAQAAFEARRSQELKPYLFQNQVPDLLYDIGKEGSGTTPICNKCQRETFYCKHRLGNGAVTLRRKGPHKTSTELVGEEITYGVPLKPQHGRKSHIKDFYDNYHLAVN